MAVDKKKIELLFQEWKKDSLLTRKGAYKMIMGIPDRTKKAIAFNAVILLSVPYLIICITFLKQYIPLSPAILVTFLFMMLIIYLLYQALPTWRFYKDRLVVSEFWVFRRIYFYSDLKRIEMHKVYSSDNEPPSLDFSSRKNFPQWKYPSKEDLQTVKFDLLFNRTSLQCRCMLGTDVHSENISRLFNSCFHPIFISHSFFEDMIRLLACVINLKKDETYRAEGRMAALRYLSQSKYNHFAYEACLDYYLNEKRASTSLFVCSSIMRTIGVEYDDRLELLTHLFECAYASDGMVDDEELELLTRTSGYLGIKEWDFLSLKYRFEVGKQTDGRQEKTEDAERTKQSERFRSVCSNRLREAYRLLNLKENASLEEVKSAYRMQVKSCHPDTLPSNATDKEKEESVLRFRTITEAYEFMCSELSAESVSVAR